MTVLAFLIGTLLPAASGWLLLNLLQGKRRTLFAFEQAVAGFVLGLTVTMICTLFLHLFAGLPLSRWGFLGAQAVLLALLGILVRIRKPGGPVRPGHPGRPRPAPAPSTPLRPWVRWTLGILGAWTLLRAITLAVTFLLLTPAFLDDTLSNWNLRGKVFFTDHALTLTLPAEDPIASPKGISSYPPTVPLAKAWYASIAGTWSEPLVNGVHFLWYASAILLLYAALRRRLSRGWSLLGTYLYASLPLPLLHGTNPYADVFVSVHVFLAVSSLFFGFTEDDPAARTSHLAIGALAAGLLPLTKNEGLLIFLPPLLLLLALALLRAWRRSALPARSVLAILGGYALPLLLFTLPWLLFKWSNGMTFGNAKPFTQLAFGWQEKVLLSVWVNTFFEGNWLLLFPLLLLLLAWRWRDAFTSFVIPAAYVLVILSGQMLLYLFTGLSTEAIRQTGYARGLVQLLPVIVLLTALLLPRVLQPLAESDG